MKKNDLIKKAVTGLIMAGVLCGCSSVKSNKYMVNLLPNREYDENYTYLDGENEVTIPVINGSEAYSHGDVAVPAFIPCLEIPKSDNAVTIENVRGLDLDPLSMDLTGCSSNSVTIQNPETNVYKAHIVTDWFDPDNPGEIMMGDQVYYFHLYKISGEDPGHLVTDMEVSADGISIRAEGSSFDARILLLYQGDNKIETDVSIGQDVTFITFDGNNWNFLK